jgi:hypothetical protein
MIDKTQLTVVLGELCRHPLPLLLGLLGEEVEEVVHLGDEEEEAVHLGDEEEEEWMEKTVFHLQDLNLC